MSISATNASVLSGGASKNGASRSRSATHSGFERRTVYAVERGRLFRANRDGRERIDLLGCPMFERQLPRLVEEDIDDGAFGRREDDPVDELLASVAAAVASDQLHACAGSKTLKTRVLAVLVR